MTTAPLVESLLAPHEHVREALSDQPLVAVGWAAAHLAAVERVLYPEACRALPDGRARVRALRAGDHRLQQALWRLDRRLTGDIHFARAAVGELVEQVRPAWAAHESGEQDLVASLAGVLGGEAQQQLGTALDAAMDCAPSRPHPHTPHGRWTGRPAYWLDAKADRFRDLMDNRLAPLPHVVAPRRRGRWASYLMGLPPAGPDR